MWKTSFGFLVFTLCFIFFISSSNQFAGERKKKELLTDSKRTHGDYNKGDDNLLKFLEETEHIDFNHPVFTETLARVTTPDMSLEQKLEKLFCFTRDTIPFDPSTIALTASGALKEMKAICYTKAMIYVSFCRRLGVPANVALEEFVIKAKPKKISSGHGITKIFYKGKWLYLDTVSNKEAWSWWDKRNAHMLELPVFSLEHNVLVDERFVSNLVLKDFETNDVPEEWLKDLEDLKGWLAKQIMKLLPYIRFEFIVFI
jgi:hypothetical protein